jgi:hypothetical protein
VLHGACGCVVRVAAQVTSRASTALLAAAFVGIVPSYISRSVAGSYDNEGVAIFALIFTFYFWVKAVKTGSLLWAMGCALAYFYMVAAWGGYVFIINIIPIYVCVLIVGGRYSPRLYTAYSVFYVVGSLLAMQVPFVGFNVIKQAECAASHGAFIFLQGACVRVCVDGGWVGEGGRGTGDGGGGARGTGDGGRGGAGRGGAGHGGRGGAGHCRWRV